jgi:hypothetical protein
MSFTDRLNYKTILIVGGTTKSFDYFEQNSAGEEHNVSESIPDASTDLEVAWDADVSAMKFFVMWAEGGTILVETNSGSVPDDSFSLIDEQPIIWNSNQLGVNPVTTDVTTNLFVTNASGGAVTLQIRMLQDATP